MDNIANNNLVAANLPSEERGWDYKQITLTRVTGYGFGIAVSGGCDNPHFASGDPSIVVSDVLASGPAERMLRVNDRIISVNGISLQNADYATAVQVLKESGDTVVLVVKRRMNQYPLTAPAYVGAPLAALGVNPPRVTLTKSSKKEDFGIVLGCKLFVKEIAPKAREQLIQSNQVLNEGDFIKKINNTSCNDCMSLKEAKKIIDATKDSLHLSLARGYAGTNLSNVSHHTQSSVSTTGAVNNFYKGDDFLTSTGQSYSNQNLYVQPPTRNNANLVNTNGYLEEPPKASALRNDKSNLRERSRGPYNEQEASRNSMAAYGRSKTVEEPPRPPPPRAEDYYSSRRQLYEEDPLKGKQQQVPDARFITFHKEGSVGIRLTGGNYVGIFVTAVQPGSPASLQGLQPGDKILKVNDMDMTGVTREEAVLFLLSLQDRIELIVQFCKEEYDNVVASQKGDSFYVKTHFHYECPAKGEMSFRSGDVFHVIDTLYNGVVGSWQVYRIGRNNQEVQKGIIPNKSRAEELATAQFNATKKEMSANESRGSFFRRRRSSNRRSKSLGKEHWDDILFSDAVSKFPAYERVLLKHPGFTRPVILFGPIADVARDKLIKDFPDKFITPQLDQTTEDKTNNKSSPNIIKLSAIREVISTGKHALLDITPNAVERLNYAQMYPIVVFFKSETKIVIKQLRQGLPKSAHKSSKKLLEQCQKLDKVWDHIFSATITLSDNTDNWYRKVREVIDKQQSGALWMSESKPEECLSDDFLFPMSSLRLSYASSPESDLEHSPGPPISPGPSASNVQAARLTKASSDPSVVMADNSASDVLPPYQSNYDSRYGFKQSVIGDPPLQNTTAKDNNQYPVENNESFAKPVYNHNQSQSYDSHYQSNEFDEKNVSHKRQSSNLHGHYKTESKDALNKYSGVPDLPPRIDRAAKPTSLHSTPTKSSQGNARSAHERLFGTKANSGDAELIEGTNGFANHKIPSLERSQNSKSDSLSSYDSFNNPKHRIIPNAHDDLKTSLSKIDPSIPSSPSKFSNNRNLKWEASQNGNSSRYERTESKVDLKYGPVSSNGAEFMESPRNSKEFEREARQQDMNRYRKSPSKHTPVKSAQQQQQQQHIETKTDYGKYSRNNQDYSRSSQQDLSQSHLSIHQPAVMGNVQQAKAIPQQVQSNFDGNQVPNQQQYKPIPPPKPKNYKPPHAKNSYEGVMQPPQSPMHYQHNKSHSNPVDPRMMQMNPQQYLLGSQQQQQQHNYYYNMPQGQQTNPNNLGWQTETAIRYNSNVGPYDMTPSYETRRHTSISFASRSEIAPISHQAQQQYATGPESNVPQDVLDPRSPDRNNIVDLQGSREQRGSAFELYRKPVHHNLRLRGEETNASLYGSQPNLANNNHPAATTNTSRETPRKLAKAQSFRCQRGGEGLSTPKFLRKLLNKYRDSSAAAKRTTGCESNNGQFEDPLQQTLVSDGGHYKQVNQRDVTAGVVDACGALLVNHYWGVSLEIPENAVEEGVQQEVYFVVSDPRLSEHAPPLDLDNGEAMLSPLVMCGPQGTEFLKPVVLHIPHYANTLPSLGLSLKATDSEANICTDWDNILLPSNHAANSVAVKVDHF